MLVPIIFSARLAGICGGVFLVLFCSPFTLGMIVLTVVVVVVLPSIDVVLIDGVSTTMVVLFTELPECCWFWPGIDDGINNVGVLVVLLFLNTTVLGCIVGECNNTCPVSVGVCGCWARFSNTVGTVGVECPMMLA